MIDDRATFLAKLDRFTGRIAEREAALLDYLAEPRTLDELVRHRFLYPPHAQLSFIDAAERRTIEQHLDRLARGQVEACEHVARHGPQPRGAEALSSCCAPSVPSVVTIAMSRTCVIVGAGPAGLAAAQRLRPPASR